MVRFQCNSHHLPLFFQTYGSNRVKSFLRHWKMVTSEHVFDPITAAMSTPQFYPGWGKLSSYSSQHLMDVTTIFYGQTVDFSTAWPSRSPNLSLCDFS
ncbi:hypothetical protein TNCV_1464801 [Trichonephila clavipes]|nr:hypothetical protein TNCV_1464801 [Trichonephila clavipes]